MKFALLGLLFLLSHAEMAHAVDFASERARILAEKTMDPLWRMDEITQKMEAAAEEGKWAEVKGFAEERLKVCPVDAMVWYFLATAAEKLGDREGYLENMHIYFSALTAIAKTGNGTVEKPYVVISSTEEYILMNELGIRSEGQNLVENCDRHVYTDPSGAKQEIFFDAAYQLDYLSKTLKQP